ncbi:uncharacterized protein LOC135379162 [Ornithodoros turicata]|uniref:uncharacterized protein LOC135379162 n=1 Tax=Ornithodoros turicata TaxID=34597 RepID=UPI00313881C4
MATLMLRFLKFFSLFHQRLGEHRAHGHSYAAFFEVFSTFSISDWANIGHMATLMLRFLKFFPLFHQRLGEHRAHGHSYAVLMERKRISHPESDFSRASRKHT